MDLYSYVIWQKYTVHDLCSVWVHKVVLITAGQIILQSIWGGCFRIWVSEWHMRTQKAITVLKLLQHQ